MGRTGPHQADGSAARKCSLGAFGRGNPQVLAVFRGTELAAWISSVKINY